MSGTSGTSLGSRSASKKHLNDITKRNPHQEIVGTGWVVTEKVIQCEQDYIKTDAPTGVERRLLRDARSSTSGRLALERVDAQSAYLQSDAIKNAPPGTKQGKSLWQRVQSTGPEMLDIRGTSTTRKCSKPLGSWNQRAMDMMDLKLSRTSMIP